MEIARDSPKATTHPAEKPEKIKLFEDESFTLADGIARREIYKPLGKKKSKSSTKAVIGFNLTKNHFKTNGAASFSELKDETRVLLDLVMNALCFATDKKSKISQTAAEKKKSRAREEQEQKKRKGVPSSSEREEEAREAQEAEAMEVESEKRAMNGNRHLRVVFETLVERLSPKDRRLRVAGIRVWIYDSSSDAKQMDLVTKALKECFIESGHIHQEVQEQIVAHNKTQTRMKKHLQRVMEKSPKYLYTDIRNDALFLNQVCDYFTSDDNHSTNKVKEGDNHYIDKRKFLSSHGDNGKLSSSENTMPSLFSKELAMFAHVEQAGIVPEQRCLESYYGKDSYDIRDAIEDVERRKNNPKRLSLLKKDQIGDDAELQQYPFPSITYRVKCNRLSHDLFSEMPLPHRIGSFLYQEEDKRILLKQLAKQSRETQEEEEEEEDDDNWEENQAKRERPLGMHDTEEELTITHMQEYRDLLSSVMKECLRKGTAISSLAPNELTTFRSKVASKVRKDLMLVNDNIRCRKKDLTIQRPHNAPVGSGISSGNGGFHTTSLSFEGKENYDKKYMLCRKIASITGLDEEGLMTERRKKLADAELSYYLPYISPFRPVEPNLKNVKKVVGKCKYDETYMERDIFLVLDVLNEYGFQQIDKKFYGDDGRIREGEGDAYSKTKRLFTEAITVEYWTEFFKNGRVSMAHLGIREDLEGKPTPEGKRKRYGRVFPVANFNIKTRPYGIFKEWVYGFFRDYGAINLHYKTMNALYFARFHHCRSYAPGVKNPKLNIVLHGQGMGGKSHRLGLVKDACPTGVPNSITHWTAQIFNTDMNLNDMLIIYEELSNKLIAPSAGKGGGGSSESANDDSRNNFKEQTTAGETKTASYFQDEETGDRKVKFSKCQCQNVILGATNNDLTHTDPNVISRFIVMSVPKSKNEHVGTRAQDLMRHRMGIDTRKSEMEIEEHREVHRIYFMIEQLIKSGILGDTYYGTAIDGADTLIKEILDINESKYGIKTGDVRKRNHVIEMSRCMCISYACWYGLCSPLTRHLQHDPVTNEFIGLNPRVILEGIVPHLVITKDMVIDALTTLSCLWGHESVDAILENVSTVQCKLHELRDCDFAQKSKSDKNGIGASSGISTGSAQKKKSKLSVLGDLNNFDDPISIDYNYISLSGRSQTAIHEYISQNLGGDVCISAADVSKVLHELGRTFHECDGYVLQTNPTRCLVRSDDKDHRIKRKIVDYGSDIHGSPCLVVSVAYLKQKLPHLFPDSIIQDASLVSFKAPVVDGPEGVMEVEDKERRDQIMETICIKANSAFEDSMIKSIRHVLENNVLEYDPEDPGQFDLDENLYQDYEFGTVPWLNFVTANNPPSLMTEQLFPDLYDAYSKLPQHNKDLPLADQMSILQLKRNPNGRPLVIYNYNTVLPTTKSCLSVYSYDDPECLPESAADPEDPYVIRAKEEMAYIAELDEYRRNVTQRRFKLYSESPSLYVNKDIDLISCKEHLIRIGHTDQFPTGRLCNYPPHVYIDMADYRARVFPDSNSLGLYANVAHKIAVTREIIESKIAESELKFSRTYVDVMFANYHQLDRDQQEQNLFRSNHGAGFIRRSPEVIAREKKKAQDSLALFGQKYRLNDVGKINTTVLKRGKTGIGKK